MTIKQHFFSSADLSITEFKSLCNQNRKLANYSFVKEIKKKIPILLGSKLTEIYLNQQRQQDLNQLKSELHSILKEDAGVLVIEGFFENLTVIKKSNEAFQAIISKEKKSLQSKGDHFANPNTNERIWNSFEKSCYHHPSNFYHYYRNPLFNLIHEAWLGPHYQITTQVNVVKPGGKPQVAHRDYHLGFQNETITSTFPIDMQVASQLLTLQGAIAHCDIPLESGPTLLLPFSQLYSLGYLAFRQKKFTDYFHENLVQLPLKKGDAIFFNPALFHAAGENQTTTIQRIVNLVQTSSAFGKTMESIDRGEMLKQLYPTLLEKREDKYNDYFIRNVANGYSFPTNLDKNPPLAGNTPQSMLDLLREALQANLTPTKFNQKLIAFQEKNNSR